MTTITNAPWIVDFKKTVSEIDDDTNEDVAWIIEYSVVRGDNEHGFSSWGWDGDEKLMLFRCAYDPYLDTWRKDVCREIALALNAKQL